MVAVAAEVAEAAASTTDPTDLRTTLRVVTRRRANRIDKVIIMAPRVHIRAAHPVGSHRRLAVKGSARACLLLLPQPTMLHRVTTVLRATTVHRVRCPLDRLVAKEVTREVIKEAIKEVIKEGTREEIGEVTRVVTKAATKEVIKAVIMDPSKEDTKEASRVVMVKVGHMTTGTATTRAVVEGMTEAIAGKGVKLHRRVSSVEVSDCLHTANRTLCYTV